MKRIPTVIFEAVALAMLTLAPPLFAQMKLREELISRQREGGYTLAYFSRGSVNLADFTRKNRWSSEELPPPAAEVQDGLLSPSGALIALWLPEGPTRERRFILRIVRRDGSGLREYKGISGGLCWSLDNKRLVVTKERVGSPGVLGILDVQSDRIDEIGLPPNARLTPQCWSPDGQKLVYYVQDHDTVPWIPESTKKKELPNRRTIFIYDIVQKQRYRVTRGEGPTWSPSGEWIAYSHKDGYYRIRPSGEDIQRLVKYKDPELPMLWSPDSRLVVYFRCCYLWPSLECMCDVGRWFVRRLADHAEVQVAEGSPINDHDVWIKTRTP